MKSFLLLALTAGLLSPIAAKAEKWSEKEKKTWTNYVMNHCPANSLKKSKTDRRMLVFRDMAKENNIQNVEKTILIPAFKTYCDCMVTMVNIDIEDHIDYMKSNCLPMMQSEIRTRLNAEIYLNNQ